MRQHIHALQAEIRQLEQALRATRRAPRQPNWVEAEWDERL
jgi:hypothetical protein